jgi:tetratricopeptide (TPR) repeat protein
MCTDKWFHPPLWCGVLAFELLTFGALAQDSPPTRLADLTKTGDQSKSAAESSNTPAGPKLTTPFTQGMELYRERDLPAAMAKFKDAAEQGGEDAAASYAWLSRLQLQMRRPEDAAVSVDKALELNKDLPTAGSAKGEVLYRQGKFAEAQETFRRIVMADKPDARAYLGLAKIHWTIGNYKSAKLVIDHAYNLDPKDPEIFWRWFATLDESERLAPLKVALASASNTDAKQTAELKRALEVRDEREKRPPSSCKLVSAGTSTEIKLETIVPGPKRFGGLAIAARLNDAKVTLRVDTGGEGITISARAAERAGLQRFSENRFTGVRDFAASPNNRGYVDKITLGDLQFKDCYVHVVDHFHSDDEDGFIGTNILEDFLVDLDFPNKKLRLEPLEPLPDIDPMELSLHSGMPIKPEPHNRIVPEKYANFEKVYRVGRDLLIPTRVNDSPPKLFLLDTGGRDNMISLALAREVSKVTETRMKNVYQAEDLTLTFGGFQQRRLSLLALDFKGMSEDAETEVSGLLGFAMLGMLDIKIDYRDHLVDFQVNPNGRH